jgi:hypothetical protein
MTHTIATPAPASEMHLKEKMLAFATTATVHVRGIRVQRNLNPVHTTKLQPHNYREKKRKD